MPLTLYWMQAGGCGGDTMSLLNAESPSIFEVFAGLDIEVLWHPSLSNGSPRRLRDVHESLRSGDTRLDILCLEGAVLSGPNGTGRFDYQAGGPKRDLIADLAARASHVIAVGTCAAFGGVSAAADAEAAGLVFRHREPGGFLGSGFRTRDGRPVVNLPGCPCHPSVVVGQLAAIALDKPLPLDSFNRPLEWYGLLVHQGCTRNEYHEYRVEDSDLGGKGCLFLHMGCRGPLTASPCNKLLWNRRNCKTRAGVPCFGCASPGFPEDAPFFETPNVEGLPVQLPSGVDRAHYLAYKSMAAAAAPDRLRHRKVMV